MLTSKPFSTISYNTESFLTSKLDCLVDKGILAFWAFIKHYPEHDEKKEHRHLLLWPNGRLDTDPISKLLEELDPHEPLKPLKCLPFQSSKFADWYLYVLHDVAYLAQKHQTRKYHYSRDDMLCSNDDFLNEQIHQIDFRKYRGAAEFIEAVKTGKSLKELISEGFVPASLFKQYEGMYRLFHNFDADTVFRSDRVTHTPKSSHDQELYNRLD